jgi:hypothetical protein
MFGRDFGKLSRIIRVSWNENYVHCSFNHYDSKELETHTLLKPQIYSVLS